MINARDLFIRHATSLFDGDALAAQSLLLNITSPVTHRHPAPLGSLSMNIYSTTPKQIGDILSFLRSVLPAVAFESISIESLNGDRLYPKSDGERLSSGRGQFVSRTLILIDESKMGEGKLGDRGTSLFMDETLI